ncbi:hypothetical protein LP414_32350 [Polaromonas sp. P1(28)-13]|nr:hypothetical protein LP414_32350 [Polaromonas sp. P1(28)-13]
MLIVRDQLVIPALPLAAFGLLNPMVAGATMTFSSVSVVMNALLLRRWRPRRD